MPELSVNGAAQARTEMLKSQFINGLPEPYKTHLYENPQLTFQPCQITGRLLMAAAQLSLLSNSLLNTLMVTLMPFLPTPSLMQATPPFQSNRQFKVEPYLPTNASRPCYDDQSRYDFRQDSQNNNQNRYYERKDYDRDIGRDYSDRQPRYDY